MTKPVRWQQRYSNFKKASIVFHRRMKDYRLDKNNEAFQMALIQAFEIVFELAWKTMKDYLEFQGYSGVTAPKQIIRQAFQDKMIEDGALWLEALDIRNETSHVYNDVILKKVLVFTDNIFSPVLDRFDQHFETLR